MLYLEDDVKIVQGFLEKGKSGLTLVMDFLHPFSFQEHLKQSWIPATPLAPNI